MAGMACGWGSCKRAEEVAYHSGHASARCDRNQRLRRCLPGIGAASADNHLIELAIAGGASYIVTRNLRDLSRGELSFPQLRMLSHEDFIKDDCTMSALTVRLLDDKHQRLSALAEKRGTTLNRLINDMATVMLAEFDAEARFKLRAVRGAGKAKRGLALLEKAAAAERRRARRCQRCSAQVDSAMKACQAVAPARDETPRVPTRRNQAWPSSGTN